MNWWTENVDMSWLGSMTTWWILGPALIVVVLWGALKLSQRPRGGGQASP